MPSPEARATGEQHSTREVAPAAAQGAASGGWGEARPNDEKKIVDILIGQRQRGEEWKASLEGLDREARREVSYQAMKEIRDWRTQQLQTHFDANVVQQLGKMFEPKQARKERLDPDAAPRRQYRALMEKADRSDKIQRRKQKKNDGR